MNFDNQKFGEFEQCLKMLESLGNEQLEVIYEKKNEGQSFDEWEIYVK